RARAVLRRHLVGPSWFGIDDADKIDVAQGGQQPRMMLAEVADADHRHSKRLRHSTVRGGRPTIVISASLADANTASPSSTSVLPASIDSAVAPATRIA